MRTPKRSHLTVCGLAAIALVATACGSSSTSPSSSSSGSSVSLSSGLQALNPGSGAPKAGGTLNMLGIGDVDYMDYNISYYTIGGLGQRMWVRGLYAYPAVPGKTTTPAPDLATALPVVSNGGLTYSVTIRSGARWDTTPFTPVTAADALLGLKRSCNPAPAVRRAARLHRPDQGLPDVLHRVRLSQADVGVRDQVVHRHPQHLGRHRLGPDGHLHLTHPASYFKTCWPWTRSTRPRRRA